MTEKEKREPLINEETKIDEINEQPEQEDTLFEGKTPYDANIFKKMFFSWATPLIYVILPFTQTLLVCKEKELTYQ